MNPIKQKKGAGIDFVFPDKGLRSTDSTAAEGELAEAPARPLPKTGVGLISGAMFETHRLEERVAELNQQVQQLTTERGAQRIDPLAIAQSHWANRHQDSFSGPAWEAFKGEIADAGGNVQPVKLRRLKQPKGEGGQRLEIVYGHRRHRACLELGLPVLAVIDDEMDDQRLFVEMERENRGRENLSAWEQGRAYLRALEEGLFPSNIKLALAIGRDPSDVGKATRIAKLPQELTSAFQSPIQIQFQWAGDLERAFKEHPNAVLAVARSVGASQPRLGPVEVFKALTECLRAPGVGSSHPPRKLTLGPGKTAVVKTDAKGRTTIQLSAGTLPAAKLDALETALRKLLG